MPCFHTFSQRILIYMITWNWFWQVKRDTVFTVTLQNKLKFGKNTERNLPYRWNVLLIRLEVPFIQPTLFLAERYHSCPERGTVTLTWVKITRQSNQDQYLLPVTIVTKYPVLALSFSLSLSLFLSHRLPVSHFSRFNSTFSKVLSLKKTLAKHLLITPKDVLSVTRYIKIKQIISLAFVV